MIERFVGQVTANINQFHGAGLYPYRSPTWSVQAQLEDVGHLRRVFWRHQIGKRVLVQRFEKSLQASSSMAGSAQIGVMTHWLPGRKHSVRPKSGSMSRTTSPTTISSAGRPRVSPPPLPRAEST